MMTEDRPADLKGSTLKVETGCGNVFVMVNGFDAYPIFEVFAHANKNGDCSACVCDSMTRLINISLRMGINPDVIVRELRNIKCPKSNVVKHSCPDAIALAMEKYMENEYDFIDFSKQGFKLYDHNYSGRPDIYSEKCPTCGSGGVALAEGCMTCMSCGWSACSV